MARVRVLNDIVVNQIAAGEVVERPASVVKELVENSIDAGAATISVVIHNGGQQLIEVIDDGSGMSREDALLAIERFGTSKIESVEDLTLINTHGFRGEALPSIASVSKFSLLTKERDSDGDGVEIEIDGGNLVDVRALSASPGTRLRILQLFHNVPARRRFMRSERTETGLIKSVMLDFAAGYPEIRFRLVSDAKEILNCAPCKSFEERVAQQKMGGEAPLNIQGSFPVAGTELKVSGALCQPIFTVGSSSKMRVLVNRRSIRSNVIIRAVRDGYGTMLKPGKYPSGVIRLELPAEELDVNVHPQKAEVRFRSSDLIYTAVVRSVANAISQRGDYAEAEYGTSAAMQNSSSSAAYSSAGANYSPPVFSGSSTELKPQFAGSASSQSYSNSSFGFSTSASVGNLYESSASDVHWNSYRFVGQVLGCFLIMEGAEDIALVDMHAAHERVTFFRLMEQYRSAQVSSQRLLIPEQLEVPMEKLDAVSAMQEGLQALGFDYEVDEQGLLTILALPALLRDANPVALFDEILALEDDPAWSGVIGEMIDAIVARIACHGSVRSGRMLQNDEVYPLLEALDEVENSAYCPHGRPIVHKLSRHELETMFGRIQ